MYMDEKNKDKINKLGEQLPLHSPDPGAWQRLAAKLDAMDAEAAYQENLQLLPVHSPNQGTWNLIHTRLNRIAYYKNGIRIALSAAAGLLLFFTVSRISDQYQNKENSARQVAGHVQQNIPVENIKTDNSAETPPADTQKPDKKSGIKHITNATATNSADHKSKTIYQEPKVVSSVNNDNTAVTLNQEKEPEIATSVISDITAIALNQESVTDKAESAALLLNTGNAADVITGTTKPIPSENHIPLQTQSYFIPDDTLPPKAIINTAEEPRSILFQKEPYPTITSTYIKQYPPPAPMPASNKNHVGLAMNYLPENIYNGTDNSLFHNVDLTASYNKEKVRYNTSLGMAYNEEQIKFEMNYDINTPVTAVDPSGHLDTLSYNVSNMESEYLGTEKHKYVTYNLGIGRRLYAKGKFSTWLNAGAGFGIKLNEPDLITTTASSIKGQYNSQRVSVSSSTPVYNDVNVNFVTAINFNYKIINKLSISFTPTSRWYFKPVLSLNNQATDELTLGFMSGLTFEF